MDIRPVGTLTQPSAVSFENAVPQPAVKPAASVETANAVQPPQQTYSPQKLAEALKSINETIQAMSPGVEFTIDDESHRTIIKVVDQQNKQVIRQIPSEEVIEISNALDRLQGLLIRQTA